jgi:phage N-6-adenine-methyltransferase
MKRCAAKGCSKPLDKASAGRPRRDCSNACRQRAYRRRQQPSAPFTSKTDEWPTPPDFFDQLDAEFGFDLDPCATPANARCARYFTREDEGLAQPWTGRVFCNPLYGRPLAAWMAKAWQASQTTAELVVCPVPARTGTPRWHDYAMRGEVRFLRGRLSFGDA